MNRDKSSSDSDDDSLVVPRSKRKTTQHQRLNATLRSQTSAPISNSRHQPPHAKNSGAKDDEDDDFEPAQQGGAKNRQQPSQTKPAASRQGAKTKRTFERKSSTTSNITAPTVSNGKTHISQLLGGGRSKVPGTAAAKSVPLHPPKYQIVEKLPPYVNEAPKATVPQPAAEVLKYTDCRISSVEVAGG